MNIWKHVNMKREHMKAFSTQGQPMSQEPKTPHLHICPQENVFTVIYTEYYISYTQHLVLR